MGEGNFIGQEYLPETIASTTFYDPGKMPGKIKLRKFLPDRWRGKT